MKPFFPSPTTKVTQNTVEVTGGIAVLRAQTVPPGGESIPLLSGIHTPARLSVVMSWRPMLSVAAPAVLLILGEANALFGFGARQSDVTEARATAMALIRENAAGDDFVPPAGGVGRRDAARFIAARASGKLACGDSSSSSVVSWEMVNDDFCDCQDGSDEPGTSACSNGECGLVGVYGGYYWGGVVGLWWHCMSRWASYLCSGCNMSGLLSWFT